MEKIQPFKIVLNLCKWKWECVECFLETLTLLIVSLYHVKLKEKSSFQTCPIESTNFDCSWSEFFAIFIVGILTTGYYIILFVYMPNFKVIE